MLNRIYQICVFTGLLALASCTKKLDTNQHDPNGVSILQLHGKDIFAQTLVYTVTDKVGANPFNAVDNYDYAQQWMGYWARNTGWASSGSQQQMETYTLGNSFANGIWGSLYHNIYDYDFIIANSVPNSILPGASRVLRAMVFQDLVDQFGNIPYRQAAMGGVIITPAYDSATDVYKDLIPQLDTAITSITASQATADDASDVMFKGNKSLWLEFANTIKLRVLLRQVPKGDQTYVKTEINNILTQGSGFLGASQDALVNPGFADAQLKQNPFWAVYGFQVGGVSAYQNNNFFTANNFILNFLNSTKDPRVAYYFAKNAQGGIGGNFFGETGSSTAQTSAFGPGLLQSPAAAALLFSASQSFFMQAEAVQRGLMPGSYTALFKQGVEESFRYLGVPNPMAAADAFMAGSANAMVNITVSANPLQTILYQKWVAECGLDGLEAYSDFRRTGYPVNATPSYATPGPFPKRLLYPFSEYTQNPVNVNTQHQQPGDLYTAIFWGM